MKIKNYPQQIANCIAGAVVCVVSAPFLNVFVLRTLTLFEFRNDNLQVTVTHNFEMSRSNSWIFGLIFLAAFVYVAWNGFELPKFFLGKTDITTGKIVNTYHKWGVRGGGSYQRLKFVYSANDSVYFNFITVGKKYGRQNIGNRVKIKYSLQNPEKCKVEAFYNDYQNSDEEKFHTNENIGLSEISLTNGLYTLTKYGKQGKIIIEKRGDYEFKNDSLILETFDKKEKIYFLITSNGDDMQLIDCETKLKFTK